MATVGRSSRIGFNGAESTLEGTPIVVSWSIGVKAEPGAISSADDEIPNLPYSSGLRLAGTSACHRDLHTSM